jgi:hypothetical protein
MEIRYRPPETERCCPLLTNRAYRGLREIAMQNGAYACFVTQFTSGEDLDRAIQRAIAFVGWMPKEDLHRPF